MGINKVSPKKKKKTYQIKKCVYVYMCVCWGGVGGGGVVLIDILVSQLDPPKQKFHDFAPSNCYIKVCSKTFPKEFLQPKIAFRNTFALRCTLLHETIQRNELCCNIKF